MKTKILGIALFGLTLASDCVLPATDGEEHPDRYADTAARYSQGER